jgi:hypothetical protein
MNLPPITCGLGIVPVNRPMGALIVQYRRRRRVCERNPEDSADDGDILVPGTPMRRPG